MKCTMVRRILSSNLKKSNLLKHFIIYRHASIEKICMSKLDIKYVHVHSPFYRQVLEFWYALYSREPESLSNIANFVLWDNKFILVDDKPVHFENWCARGIRYVGNILNGEGYILSKEELENKNNVRIKQMEYNSLIHAIPKHWLHHVKGNNVEIGDDLASKILIGKKRKDIKDVTCKDIYWEYILNIGELPKSEKKWNSYLHMENTHWQDHYVIPFNVCRETSLQTFQYKIFHRFFPCNYTLSIWYKDKNKVCNYCNETDYLDHYFFS